MIEYQEFRRNVEELESRVWDSVSRAGRSLDEVRILPVTKTFPIQAVEYAIRYGFDAVGENRVQEVVEKQGDFRHKIKWELIGHLQTNKVKPAVKHFDSVQSVDSLKLVDRLERNAKSESCVLDVHLQFNAGADPNKYGLDVRDADSVVESVLKCDHLKLSGFMTIAPLSDDPSVARKTFSVLRELKDRINRDFGLSLSELSMGMSGDLDLAILEGSTCIRVGTALFGKRPPLNAH